MDAAVKSVEMLREKIGISDILTPEELCHFKRKLVDKKAEIVAQSRLTIESNKIRLDANEMKDEIDLASMTIEQDLTFRLLDRSRKLLKEIDHALRKIESGDYGYCEGTGEVIPKKRLDLAPWVRHSVEHKQLLERRKNILRQSKGGDSLRFFG